MSSFPTFESFYDVEIPGSSFPSPSSSSVAVTVTPSRTTQHVVPPIPSLSFTTTTPTLESTPIAIPSSKPLIKPFSEIRPGMKHLDIIGRVISKPSLKTFKSTFKSNNGMTSMLQSIFVKDDTDILCVKVWGNEGHSVGEWGEVGVGDLVQVRGSATKLSTYDINNPSIATLPYILTTSPSHLRVIEEREENANLYTSLLHSRVYTIIPFTQFLESSAGTETSRSIMGIIVSKNLSISTRRQYFEIMDSQGTILPFIMWTNDESLFKKWRQGVTVLVITNPVLSYWRDVAQVSVLEGDSFIEVDPRGTMETGLLRELYGERFGKVEVIDEVKVKSEDVEAKVKLEDNNQEIPEEEEDDDDDDFY